LQVLYNKLAELINFKKEIRKLTVHSGRCILHNIQHRVLQKTALRCKESGCPRQEEVAGKI